MTKRLLTLTSQTEKCKELLFQRHKENVQLFFPFKSGDKDAPTQTILSANTLHLTATPCSREA